MRASKIICFAVGAMVVSTTACAEETVIVSNLLGPEGPLYIDGNLYYVGWVSHTLSKWDGKTSTVLNHTPGCGHNGLALTAYATVFGPYKDLPTSVAAKILYLAPGSEKWVEVADDLNYANGIGVSPDQTTLYVSETVGNCILKFKINDDGSLSNRSNFALLNLLTPNKVESWWLGPDSMKVDSKGNIYVAQWFGGKILKISPEGELLHVFKIGAGDGTTNVAFGEGEKDLYVTVVKGPKDPQAKGMILKIANVK